jgi:hypothetical protein
VALDCRDPETLAAFWCAALGYRVREWWSDAAGTGYVETGGMTVQCCSSSRCARTRR